MGGASKACLSRLQKEYQRLGKEPVPNVVAEPKPSNILEWHFVITGPADSPFENGQYHGKLVFPSEYPYKPPAIMMLTPNGRFNTNTRLCLSMSDFHPETWVPAWSVASILQGVISFMLEATPTVGSVETSPAEKRRLARISPQWNRKTAIFCELFPDCVQPESADAPAEEGDRASDDAGGGNDRGGNLSPWVLGFLAIACAVALGAYFEAQ